MIRFLFLVLWAVAGSALPVSACTVCFGDPNSPMVKSLAWGIWVLMGFIGGVLALFVVFFLNVRRRMKKLDKHD